MVVMREATALRKHMEELERGGVAGAREAKATVQDFVRDLQRAIRKYLPPDRQREAMGLLGKVSNWREYGDAYTHVLKMARRIAQGWTPARRAMTERQLNKLAYEHEQRGASMAEQATRNDVADRMRRLAEMAKDILPASERGKALKMADAIARAKQPATVQKYFDQAKALMDKWADTYARKAAHKQLKGTIKTLRRMWGGDLHKLDLFDEDIKAGIEEDLAAYTEVRMSAGVRARTEATLKYLTQNPDAILNMPPRMLADLRRLSQTALADLDEDTLLALNDDLEALHELALRKMKLRWAHDRAVKTRKTMECVLAIKEAHPQAANTETRVKDLTALGKLYRSGDNIGVICEYLQLAPEGPLVEHIEEATRDGFKANLVEEREMRAEFDRRVEAAGISKKQRRGMNRWGYGLSGPTDVVTPALPRLRGGTQAVPMSPFQAMGMRLALTDEDHARSLTAQTGGFRLYTPTPKWYRAEVVKNGQVEADAMVIRKAARWGWDWVAQRFIQGEKTDVESLGDNREAAIQALEDVLTPEQIMVSDIIGEMINDEAALKGVFKEGLRRLLKIDTPVRAEFYYPKTIHEDFVPRTRAGERRSMPGMAATLANMRITHARTGATYPVLIRSAFEVLADYTRQVTSLKNLGLVFSDVHAILNNTQFRRAINRVRSTQDLANLNVLFARFEEGRMAAADPAADAVQIILNRITASIIPLRVSVILAQLGSIPAFSSSIPMQHMLVKPHWAVEQAHAKKLIMSNPIWRDRFEHGAFGRDLGDVLAQADKEQWLTGRTSFVKITSAGVRATDFAAFQVGQLACMDWARSILGKQASQADVDALAVKLFDRAARETQPMWNKLDRTVIGSSPNPFWRGFTMFGSFFRQRVNRLKRSRYRWDGARRRYQQAKALGNPADIMTARLALTQQYIKTAWTAAVMIMGVFIANEGKDWILNELIPRRKRDPRDEQKRRAKRVGRFFEFQTRGVLPFFDKVASAAVVAYVDNWYDRPVEPLTGAIHDSGVFLADVIKAAVDEQAADEMLTDAQWERKMAARERRLLRVIKQGAVLGGRAVGQPVEGVWDALERVYIGLEGAEPED